MTLTDPQRNELRETLKRYPHATTPSEIVTALLDEISELRSKLGPLAEATEVSGISGGGIRYVVCSPDDSRIIREGLHARDIDPQLREAVRTERTRAELAESQISELNLTISTLREQLQNSVSAESYAVICRRVAELEAQNGGWISVETEMPPVEHEVLVIHEDNGSQIQTEARRIEHNEAWFSETANEYLLHVTHWREKLPLPAAPNDSQPEPQSTQTETEGGVSE